MMEVTNKAFKAYDVRGVYPTEVNKWLIAWVEFFLQCLPQKQWLWVTTFV